MHNLSAPEIIEHYRRILGDYRELLQFTQTFEQGTQESSQVKVVMGFLEERERRLQDLKQKEANSVSLRAAVCQELELSEFTLSMLRTKISEDELNALSAVMTETQKVIEEIQEIDTRLNQTLIMELEATKLELHRFQKAQRIHHAYQTEFEREARFIDKTK